MDFNALLKLMVQKNASDLFITAGYPPSLKIHGKITPLSQTPLSSEQARQMVLSVMNGQQRSEFEKSQESNFAISPFEIGRFRVNVFQQRNSIGMVLRKIETRIPKFEELGLPPSLKEIAMTKRGLVIFVGGTGTGKSSSLAAMVGYRNEHGNGHIITIEDPIEYIHQHKNCIITQREVGIDTESYEAALKNTLRQAPDVILLGEIRSRETMDYAIAFAETGHLCLTTLHANNANQAMDRIINFFPEERRAQLLMDLSLNLKAVIAQLLIPSVDGKTRSVAVEILMNTPLAADLILKGEVYALKELMSRSNEAGMKTFDQDLFDLHMAGKISYEDAIRYADSANEVRLRVKLARKGASGKLGESLEAAHLLEAEIKRR
jgi:twitching motility protein PilU